MTAVVRVREVGDGLGYEVVRDGVLGRRAIAFRLKPEDANEVASEIYEMDRAFHLLAPDQPGPKLELWEAHNGSI